MEGEDAFNDPRFFDVIGFYGQTFSYNTSPNPWGSTAILTGFDTYKSALYVDFALIDLTLDSTAAGEHSCCLPDDSCVELTADNCVAQGGASLGPGTSCACNPCLVPPGPPPVPDGRNGTTPLVATRLIPNGDSIQVSWDAISCPAIEYNLIYGDLNSVASYALSGAVCAMGASASYVWTGVPAGNLYFLIAGTDGARNLFLSRDGN